MKIREMQIDDLEEAVSIEEELFSQPWTAEGFFSFWLRADALFFVAEEAGEIVGYCGVLMVLDQGDVINVGVRKKWQRRVIGKSLMEVLIRETADQGVTTLYLEVRASNQAAIGLYKELGFGEMGIRKGYYQDPMEDAVTMCRS